MPPDKLRVTLRFLDRPNKVSFSSLLLYSTVVINLDFSGIQLFSKYLHSLSFNDAMAPQLSLYTFLIMLLFES